MNKAILVDDTEVAVTKEYTFNVTANTTVSASFTAEPALVEVTKVATDAALTREVMGAILYDAYQLADHTNMDKYMAQNGGVPSPDDPNYDPNIKYEGSPYIPLTGWGALTDKSGLSDDAVTCGIRPGRTGYFEKLTRQFISGAKESYKSRLLTCRQGKLLLGR